METKIARLEEGQRLLEDELSETKEYIADVEKLVHKEIEKIEESIREVEGTVNEVVKSIAIIQNDSQYTREAITEIKKDIYEIRKAREDDHYIKPLTKQDA